MIARRISDCIIHSIILFANFSFFSFFFAKFNEVFHKNDIPSFYNSSFWIIIRMYIPSKFFKISRTYTLKSFAILLIYRWTRTNPPYWDRRQIFFPPIFFPIIRNGRRVQLGQSEKYDRPLPPLIRLEIQNDGRNK